MTGKNALYILVLLYVFNYNANDSINVESMGVKINSKIGLGRCMYNYVFFLNIFFEFYIQILIQSQFSFVIFIQTDRLLDKFATEMASNECSSPIRESALQTN